MILAIVVVLGLCLGSFANAVIWRLHEQAKPKNKKQRTKNRDLSIMRGRSMCSHCYHKLAWYDLLPVVSWLSVGGHCRYCHKKIEDSPLVELATALLFALSYIYWPQGWGLANDILFGLWLAIVAGFVILLVYDLRWMILPNRVVFPLQALAAVYVAVEILTVHNPAQTLVTVLWGLALSAGLFYAIFQVSKGAWIGGGDVKLAVVLGALIGGPLNAILMLFLASFVGSLVGVPMLLRNKTDEPTKLPFAPFLIIATIMVFLFSASVMAWYKHHFLIG